MLMLMVVDTSEQFKMLITGRGGRKASHENYNFM